jgi:hypothetical protein
LITLQQSGGKPPFPTCNVALLSGYSGLKDHSTENHSRQKLFEMIHSPYHS